MAIIGVLATLTIFVAGAAQKQSRDARRKSDITMISLGLQARYEAKTCSNPGLYPDTDNGSAVGSWQPVNKLRTALVTDPNCTQSISLIPSDPTQTQPQRGYLYNLSSEIGGTLQRKHYRLAAILEKTPTGQESAQFDKVVGSWIAVFGGVQPPGGFNYIVGN